MEIRQKSFDTIFFSYICKVLSVSWIETIIFSLQKKHRWRIMPEASPICIKSIKKRQPGNPVAALDKTRNKVDCPLSHAD